MLYNQSMRKETEHISQIFFAHDAAYLIGFPRLDTVESIVQSKQQFYSSKTRPTVNSFRLFPKEGLKTNLRLPNLLHENLEIISSQFEYEEDQSHYHGSSKKKNQTQKSTASAEQGSLLHKTPIYKLYCPSNSVLKEEYTILSKEALKKISTKDEQENMHQKIKEWIDVGYHIHVAQAFKVESFPGKHLIYLEKLKGRTLRSWIMEGFFRDRNKYLNSKRVLNCLLQTAVGLNYLHKRNIIHQLLIPDNVYVQNEKILKVGNLCAFNALNSKLSKSSFSGGSPEYWSPEQGSLYDNLFDRAESVTGYHSAMKLLPGLTHKSDLYQLGLIALELVANGRPWARGDKVSIDKIRSTLSEATCNKETTEFLFSKAQQLLETKAEERLTLYDFITELLTFYSANFKGAEDLLWCRFFDEQKYQSELLNNKAVGLYLSGNDSECEKYWSRSLSSNPLNLTAQFNYSHFKRMRRIIDDVRLNKNLSLLPESRKRNYYLLVSNLVMLPLLKEPFKTYNFHPKLSKQKEIEVLSKIIEALERNKRPRDLIYQYRTHLREYKFDEGHVIREVWFIGRLTSTNSFYCYRVDQDIKPHSFIEIQCHKNPLKSKDRQAFSCVDLSGKYLAVSENSYLSIFNIQNIQIGQYELFHELQDYGSSITTMEFDQKSEVLGVGSNQFAIKLINLLNKQIYKVINIGQKFIIKNLQYYDRNTCISYSYEKSVSFHRIESGKNLFTVRCNSGVFGYKILQISLASHLMIVHTSEKFEIWNLKDKSLIRNIEIDEAPKIQAFFANSAKKLVVHYTKHEIRIWNYNSGLIFKTFRTPIPLCWVHVTPDARYLRSLDLDGNFCTRYINFSEFIRSFEGICTPNEICMSEQECDDDVSQYLELGRQLVENLNDYRLNEQEKKVSLEKMYRLGEVIKSSIFYQDKQDIKAIFLYLNAVRQSEDRSSRINSHSEEYLFTSHREEFITATSNMNKGNWLIGESGGSIRMVASPHQLLLTIRPKESPVSYLHLQPASIFIGYGTACILVERESLNIIVTHTSYHKQPIRMGLILNSILVTGDQNELILFWNQERVQRYSVPVNFGDVVGNKLIIAGFDNRIRLYDVHHDRGAQKSHVFIGHTMGVYSMLVIDDGIFTSSSYDGTIRWWNSQVRICFSCFNFKKHFRGEKVLWVDMPKFSQEEQKHAKFNREGCALILLNSSEVVVFDTMRKEVKWRLQLAEEVVKVFWTDYPNTFAAVTHEQVRIVSIYWRYMVLKK